MGKNRRVVVTGMGAITPIGNSVEEFWNGIKEGKTGFGPITYFDTADYRCKLAAEVKDFDPTQYMDKKSARRMEQFCQFAVAAAGQAIADAGLTMEQEDAYMVVANAKAAVGKVSSAVGRVGSAVGRVGSAVGSIRTKAIKKGSTEALPLREIYDHLREIYDHLHEIFDHLHENYDHLQHSPDCLR